MDLEPSSFEPRGPAAASVLSYLESLGDAGAPKLEPISDEEKAALAGTYVFGRGAADRIDITLDKGNLMLQRSGMPFGRGLSHLGNKTFHPAGEVHERHANESVNAS